MENGQKTKRMRDEPLLIHPLTRSYFSVCLPKTNRKILKTIRPSTDGLGERKGFTEGKKKDKRMDPYLPAWRWIQIGVCCTGSPRAARRIISFSSSGKFSAFVMSAAGALIFVREGKNG